MRFLLVHLTHFSHFPHFPRLSAEVDVCRRTQRDFFFFLFNQKEFFIIKLGYKKRDAKEKDFYNFIEAFHYIFSWVFTAKWFNVPFFCKTNCKWGEKLNRKKITNEVNFYKMKRFISRKGLLNQKCLFIKINFCF